MSPMWSSRGKGQRLPRDAQPSELSIRLPGRDAGRLNGVSGTTPPESAAPFPRLRAGARSTRERRVRAPRVAKCVLVMSFAAAIAVEKKRERNRAKEKKTVARVFYDDSSTLGHLSKDKCR